MRSQTGRRPARTRVRGFTLIEVMVALFVTAIGLLGIAKIQALAYASTGSASVRSLVAMEAAGLAAAMHANRNYWAGGFAPPTIVIDKTGITGGALGGEGLPTSTLPLIGYCTGPGNTPCSTELMAASDLHLYAIALNTLLNQSNPTTTITCSTVSITTPVNCTVQISWDEKAVAITKQSAATTGDSTFTPAYTLFVEP